MPIKYKHMKKKYSDIPEIIDHILPKKYKSMDIRISFINRKYGVLKYITFLTIGRMLHYYRGNAMGSHRYHTSHRGEMTSKGIVIYGFALNKHCKSDTVLMASIIDTILHEIKHQWQSKNNITMLTAEDDTKCENNANRFAQVIVLNNMEYLQGKIGYFYYE